MFEDGLNHFLGSKQVYSPPKKQNRVYVAELTLDLTASETQQAP